MKRGKFQTVIAVLLSVMLVGCAELPNISEQQGDMIAEYAGGVLLRYSSKYDLRLVKNDVDEDGVEDSKELTASGSAAEASPEVSPEASPSPSASADAKESAKPEKSSEPEPTEEPEISLDELYGIRGLHFSYKEAMYTNEYPKNSDAVEITPEEGQILYVVVFKVKNTGKKAVKVNLIERQIHYELDVGGDSVLPVVSLLPNGGLNYLMTTIRPGKTEEAALIFNLDQGKRGTKGNTLTITEGEKSVTVKL